MNTGNFKVCNLDYLFELAKGDDGFVKEMISVFLNENPGEIKLLEKYVSEKNYSGIKQQTHKLRSSIPYMGLESVIGKEVTETEELASQSIGIEKIEENFRKIKSTCDLAYADLRQAAA
jgi:hypothetical protein